jgi:hypothetical protein
MCFVFYKTNNVFLAEEILSKNKIACEIVPTPVQDKAYCGVCIQISEDNRITICDLLNDIEFKVIEE